MIYFVLNGEFVKIGVSDAPRKRIASLQTGSPFPLEVLAIVEGGYELEAELHRRFAAYRLLGEWFQYAPPIQELIASMPNQHTPPIVRQTVALRGKRQEEKRHWIEFAKRGTKNPKRYAYRRRWITNGGGVRIKSRPIRLKSIPPMTEEEYIQRITRRDISDVAARRVRSRILSVGGLPTKMVDGIHEIEV